LIPREQALRKPTPPAKAVFLINFLRGTFILSTG
jgi:hypothetical protein